MAEDRTDQNREDRTRITTKSSRPTARCTALTCKDKGDERAKGLNLPESVSLTFGGADTYSKVLLLCHEMGGAHLVIVADDLLALLAGVGMQAVVAGDAVRFVLHLDVLASAQGLVAVLAVEAVAHDDDLLLSLTSCGAEWGGRGCSQATAQCWLSAGRKTKEEREEEEGAE